MAIYCIRPAKEQMKKLDETSFEVQGMTEQNVQDLLMQDENIEAIAPGVLIVDEKYNKWPGSQREMDLLGVDQQANLVVIELKRVKDGGHMELQAIRYAAMIANLTFDELVDVYAKYKNSRNDESEESFSKSQAQQDLLDHFGWSEPKPEEFGENVKIILSSADFSKELTTSVLWLNDNYNMGIRCVRMRPYQDQDTADIFLDIQAIIPLPEAEDYQLGRDKKNKIRREANRNTNQYNIEVNGKRHENLPHNRMMLHFIVAALKSSDGTPEKIRKLCKEAGTSYPLKHFKGILTAKEVRQKLLLSSKDPRIGVRFYAESDDQLVHRDNVTYVVRQGWNSKDALAVAEKLKSEFPELGIEYERAGC